jgi:dTDP-4-amino-4,6-dideoxygalactose transaminase
VLYHHGGCIYEPEQNSALQISKFPGVNYRISEISSSMLIVQLKRLDYILKTLRSEKEIIIDKLSVVDSIIRPSFINDVEGDCGTSVFYLMDTEEDAAKLIALANEFNIGAYSGRTPGHAYQDWTEVLNPSEYPIENCQKSMSILKRAVGIPTMINRGYDELNNNLQKLISIIRGF